MHSTCVFYKVSSLALQKKVFLSTGGLLQAVTPVDFCSLWLAVSRIFVNLLWAKFHPPLIAEVIDSQLQSSSLHSSSQLWNLPIFPLQSRSSSAQLHSAVDQDSAGSHAVQCMKSHQGNQAQAQRMQIQLWLLPRGTRMIIIGLGLDDNHIHHLDLDSTAHEVWEILNTLFGVSYKCWAFSWAAVSPFESSWYHHLPG